MVAHPTVISWAGIGPERLVSGMGIVPHKQEGGLKDRKDGLGEAPTAHKGAVYQLPLPVNAPAAVGAAAAKVLTCSATDRAQLRR